MIKRGILIIFFVCAFVCGLRAICSAQPLSSNDLISNARQYDGQEVTYRGQVIGEIMRRGANAWVNVSDGANAIGIWADIYLVEDIAYAGAYQVRGDTVLVTGTFHRACFEHGGALDIHARNIDIITPGRNEPEIPDNSKIMTAALLLGVLVLVWILTRLPRK